MAQWLEHLLHMCKAQSSGPQIQIHWLCRPIRIPVLRGLDTGSLEQAGS